MGHLESLCQQKKKFILDWPLALLISLLSLSSPAPSPISGPLLSYLQHKPLGLQVAVHSTPLGTVLESQGTEGHPRRNLYLFLPVPTSSSASLGSDTAISSQEWQW